MNRFSVHLTTRHPVTIRYNSANGVRYTNGPQSIYWSAPVVFQPYNKRSHGGVTHSRHLSFKETRASQNGDGTALGLPYFPAFRCASNAPNEQNKETMRRINKYRALSPPAIYLRGHRRKRARALCLTDRFPFKQFIDFDFGHLSNYSLCARLELKKEKCALLPHVRW